MKSEGNQSCLIVLIYTPLHCASFIRVSSQIEISKRSEIVFWGNWKASKRSAYYKDLVHFSNLANRVRENINGYVFVFLKCLCLYLLGRPIDLMVGNPRRTPSLLLARLARNIYLIDEGSGLFVQGGYFDPSVPEKNWIKQVLINIKVLPDYERICRKIICHYTIYAGNSLFVSRKIQYIDLRVELDFEIDEPVVNLFIASAIFYRGIEYYRTNVKQVIESEEGLLYFLPHPVDANKYVNKVFSDIKGLFILNSKCLTEDLIILLIKKGKRVRLFGDYNSSLGILSSVLREGIDYENYTVKN